MALIVASPWLMKPLFGRAQDWRELSDVGQAYGGISAILSGLALCGIAISLLFQWRHVRLTQVMTARERHFELVKLAFDDPDLQPPTRWKGSALGLKQRAYHNLWVSHWEMLWDTGAMGRLEARRHLDSLFLSDAALDWWAQVGPTWSVDGGRRRRKFMMIAHEAHRDAIQIRAQMLNRQAGVCGADSILVPGEIGPTWEAAQTGDRPDSAVSDQER